jgi:hypothetical protein
MEKHLRQLIQQYPKTRQEHLAGNAIDSCRSGEQLLASRTSNDQLSIR